MREHTKDIFRTVVSPLSSRGMLHHGRPVLMLGSCFADNIGAYLRDGLFDIEINPFGTLYNPASVAESLSRMLFAKEFDATDIVNDGHMYHSFSLHSKHSSVDPSRVIDNANAAMWRGNRILKNKDPLIVVTFGTVYVYRLLENKKIVANCHKFPASTFERQPLGVNDIVDIWCDVISRVKSVCPDAEFVFTVSPVRHRADGLHGNQLSKAALLLAVDQIVSRNECAGYFPSYEIMMDDLRDYRFYSADMCHPTETAVGYIYRIFTESYCNQQTILLADDASRLTRRLSHRPMTDDIAAHAEFHNETIRLLHELASCHTGLDSTLDRYINSSR